VQSKAGGGEKSSGGDKKAPNIIIENLYLRDSSVAVIAPLLNEKLSVPLPTIHLTDIGREGKGATPEEIADQVMSAVLKGAQDAVANAKIDINKLAGAAMEQGEKVTEDAQKAIEDATSGAGGDIGKGATNAIKGLLGK
jgi:hypothetical protein